jgi:hypothetical protein
VPQCLDAPLRFLPPGRSRVVNELLHMGLALGIRGETRKSVSQVGELLVRQAQVALGMGVVLLTVLPNPQVVASVGHRVHGLPPVV